MEAVAAPAAAKATKPISGISWGTEIHVRQKQAYVTTT